MHTIAVCGAGYVGVVTAACFAQMGNSVACYDTDAAKIAKLRNGSIPFHEPQLEELVTWELRSGRLTFHNDARSALTQCEVAFLAVGTPTGPTGEANLTHVRQATRELAKHARGSVVVVNKSTVPVETADVVARILREVPSDATFSVASNPEFLREGSAVNDFLHPDRIVIGTADDAARALLARLYEPLGAPLLAVNVHTAEMIKYAANAFLAARISLVNELANVCASVGADVDGVIAGIAADRRIGGAYLRPGLGFGGSCLPKDVSALAHLARAHSVEPTMLEAVLGVNRRQVALAVRTIEHELGDLDGRCVALLGLSFKPDTDDVRESPALALARALSIRGARVVATDPVAIGNARRELGDAVEYAASPLDACAKADAIAIATEWGDYASLDWRAVARSSAARTVFDLRNTVSAETLEAAGLHRVRIGSASAGAEAAA
jgi:UDPglucose 6-dehydrogenase